MANEATLEKPILPRSEQSTDVSDAAVASPADGTEPVEAGPYYHHWAASIGAFKDDPMLDAMMENIRQRRREMDADDNIP